MNNLDVPPSDSNIQGIDCGHSREPQRGYLSPGQRPITWSGILTRLTLCAAVALSLYALIVGLLINPYILRGSTAGRVVGVYQQANNQRVQAQRYCGAQCQAGENSQPSDGLLRGGKIPPLRLS